jgi:dTDP-4-amino-4,6-dideoxygalactose transaminase
MPGLKLGETIFTLDFPTEKMNSWVLRVGNKLMPQFDSIRKRRLELMRIYAEKLGPLKDEFAFFPKFNGEDIALLRFPIVFMDREKRDRILIELKKKGLGATGMYPVPLNEQRGVSPYLLGSKACPNAKFVSERILTLPIHEHVRVEDVEHIRQIIEKHF